VLNRRNERNDAAMVALVWEFWGLPSATWSTEEMIDAIARMARNQRQGPRRRRAAGVPSLIRRWRTR